MGRSFDAIDIGAGLVMLCDVTDSWISILDQSDLPGFHMAVLVEVCENHHDTDPVRFTPKYTRREFGPGFHSRNREINRTSSFSVPG